MSQRDSIKYTIGDRKGYRKFIKDLRKKLCVKSPMHIECKDTGRQAVKKPVLPEQQGGKQPERWIDIQLRAKMRNETSTTTLVIRDDNLYVKGFKNQDGNWFELLDPKETEEEKLPAEDPAKDYMAEELVGWGITYSSIMGLNGSGQVKRTLQTTRLGKAFAERAVRRLSCYPHNKYNDDMPVRLGLAGLLVMICEAARMDAFFQHFADQGGAWDLGMGLEEKFFGFMWNWQNMSAALLKRKYNPYRPWDSNCGVDSAQKAFDSVHLVLNSTKIEGSDGAQVEILDVSVNNFRVLEIKFIDEAQLPCKIYTQKPDEMNELELTVPGSKCISGHKWFSMEVVTPSSTGDDGGSIRREFKWDCRKQAGGDATEFVVRTIDLVSSHKVKVTYLVMSNAVKATVKVKLPLDLGLPNEQGGGLSNKQYTAQGEITAHIGGFEGYPIVLFRSVEELVTSELILPLDRSTIHVPQGKQLEIDMNRLDITEISGDGGREVKKPAAGSRLSFRSGSSSPTPNDDSEVQVNVTWEKKGMLQAIEPTQVCSMTIGSKQDFTTFIDDLTSKLADKPFDRNIWLTWLRATQPQRWIHVELRVETGEEKWSTTLAVPDGKCYGVGFLNQSQVWYELGKASQDTLPPEYKSVHLGWGLSYEHILDLTDDWDKVIRELNSEGLGKKSFAEKAVRTLSRYPDVDEDDLNPRVALAGLIIMVCESARFNPLLKFFQDNWDNNTQTGFSEDQIKYIWSWGKISRSLLLWKDNGEWPKHDDPITATLEERGIENEDDALAAVRLVYSDARALEFHPTVGGFTTDELVQECFMDPPDPVEQPQCCRCDIL